MICFQSCAFTQERCHSLDQSGKWQYLDPVEDYIAGNTRGYVRDQFRGLDENDTLAWYEGSDDRFAACEPGRRRDGCGDITMYFSIEGDTASMEEDMTIRHCER